MTAAGPSDVERWAPWQREYRHGAFCVFPPPAIMEAVDALRAEHDPTSHATIPAHVTVTGPVPRPLTDEDVRDVGRAVSAVAPFRVSYTGPRWPDPHAGVIYWIEPQETFRTLRDLVHRQPIFRGVEQRRRGIPAHMTVAEFVTVEESRELAARLAGAVPEGSWICDSIELAVPDADFRFRRRLSLPFGGG